VTILSPDRPPKEKAAPPQRSAAFLKSTKNRADSEADGVSSLSVATFSPGAQAGLYPFTRSEISPPPVLPADSYGYGGGRAGRAVRADLSRSTFSRAKTNWKIPEQPSAKLTLVQSVPKFTSWLFEGIPQDDIERWRDFHRSLLQRYVSNGHVADLLEEGGYVQVAADIRRCGRSLVFQQRERCGRLESWRCLYGCNQRFCAFCSRSKANDKFRDIWPAVQAYSERKPYLRPCSVVLTYKDDSSDWVGLRLKEKIKRTQQALRKFIRLKEFKAHITGGVWSIENTKNSSNNDHLHVHMLVFRMSYWVKQDLENLWEKSTGGLGGWTWIGSNRDIKSSLKETLKYAMKPVSVERWTVDDAVQFVECKGLRLTSRFGELYGLKLTAEEQSSFDALRAEDEKIARICPACGRENEAVIDITHTRLTADMEVALRLKNVRGP